MPTYWVDMCSGDHAKGRELEDVNLIKNPERNTGYNGSHIWQARLVPRWLASLHGRPCTMRTASRRVAGAPAKRGQVGSAMPRGRFGSSEHMCYEERVLYRLLSGWHASTSISIAKNYYAPGPG